MIAKIVMDQPFPIAFNMAGAINGVHPAHALRNKLDAPITDAEYPL